ncbi:Splicing factor [Kickxella alabastrina]|uniref:Splicing factor n=1 Tax=Kickxella alabastrina TaxID=61397 RepID=A0ACC1IET3_9FUNG|nr:Splicing factor [Kickxella alabastrina]
MSTDHNKHAEQTQPSEQAQLDELDALQRFMESLPEKLEKSPYDYTTYLQWIELLRPVADIASLRAAREHMWQNLAVPEDLWAKWVADERTQPDALHDPTAIAYMRDLLERAAKEYLSVSAWQNYIDFVREVEHSEDEQTRAAAASSFGSENYLFSALQEAAAATYAHFKHSNQIWSQYRECIEQEIEKSEGSQREALVDLLQAVYLQRLGCPHAELEATFSMYSSFVTKFMNASYEQHMVEANAIVSATRQSCAKREDYEAELAASGTDWAAFKLYIDKLTRDKAADPAEISVLYERAVALNYYTPAIWDEYIAFAAANATEFGAEVVLCLSSRAVRNCPWSGRLWAQLLRAVYEQQGYAAAAGIYDRALATYAVEYSMCEFSQLAVAFVAVARLEYSDQQRGGERAASAIAIATPQALDLDLLAVCEGCLATAHTLQPETADPLLHLERCCTSAAVHVLADAEAARRMWTSICKSRKVCAEAWVLSADFERTNGTEDSTRSVFRHASQRRLDNPERLFDAWLAFEHSFGTLESLRCAEIFIQTQRHLIWRRLEREAQTQGQAQAQAQVPEHPQSVPAATAASSAVEDAAQPGRAEHDQSNKKAKRKRDDDISSPLSLAPSKGDGDGGNQRSTNSVFVSGLPLAFTTENVEALLGGSGSVSRVTMLTNKEGGFRGQARADLLSNEAMIVALDKNGVKVDGQFVSVHVFKQHSQHLHPHPHPTRSRAVASEVAVKVTGFSPETGNKQLEGIAKQVGSVVRVRRNQQGDAAFVTMRSMDDAKRALGALDGCSVDGRVLSANIDEPGSSNVTGDGVKGQGADSGNSAATKTDAPLSLVPRRAAGSRQPAKRLALAKKGLPKPDETADRSPAPAASEGARSNADFRNLFLTTQQGADKQENSGC